MKVGIIGSRNCKNFNIDLMEEYLPDACDEIVSGGAEGIDQYAEALAQKKNLPVKRFLPDYQKYGKRAPLERNLLIVQNSDLVLAFWDCYSRGTAHTIDACIRSGVPVRVIPFT